MELVKKNLTSIICGVIALLAVVALFWPISGYYKELQDKAEGRKQVYTALKGIYDKKRNMPVVDLNTTEAKELPQFPTQAVIDWGKGVMDQVKAQSGSMFDTLLKMNQHKPLVEGALPEGSPTIAGRFRRLYNEQILIDLFALLNPQGGQQAGVIDPKRIEEKEKASFIFTKMQAGFPPTP